MFLSKNFKMFAWVQWPSVTVNIMLALIISAIFTESFGSTTMMSTAIGVDANKTVHDLYLIGLFPFSGSWDGGRSLLAAATLAVNQINSLPHVLPGYRLNIIYNDTKCEAGLGVKALFDQIVTPPTKIMVLGGGCSSVTEATARISGFWNLVQVSCATVPSALFNKSKFPLFASMSAPNVLTNVPRMEFFRRFNWKRIATIHETHTSFVAVINDLIDKMRKANFTILGSEMFKDDPKVQVRHLKEKDSRIIVGAFYSDMARKVLCEAYKIKLYGQQVVWIFPGYSEDQWWLKNDKSIDCSPQQLSQALEGSFQTGIVYVNPKSERTVSGWRPSDFFEEYKKSVKGKVLPGETRASIGYDAVWTMALALNRTRQWLEEMGSRKGLEHFTYEDSELAHVLYGSLLNVSFMGVQGPISFTVNGEPKNIMILEQIQHGVRKLVGWYNTNKEGDSKFEWLRDNPIIWQGGFPPKDSNVIREQIATVATPLYIAMCFLAALSIILTASLLAFNIIHRDLKIVKMSAPHMNSIILLGCFCMFSAIFVDHRGSHGAIGCEVRTVLLSMGSSLAFGALFAKTWKVHVVFMKASKLQTRVGVMSGVILCQHHCCRVHRMRDGDLFAFVLILLVLDVFILVTWWILDLRTLQVVNVTSTKEDDGTGEMTVKRYELGCRSQYYKYFQTTLYGINAILLFFGTLLAWETRKVNYEDLNDSKYIGMCMYNMVLLFIPMMVLAVAPASNVNLEYAINSFLLLLATNVTQCLIFVPKVLHYLSQRRHSTADNMDNFSNITRDDTSGVTTQDDTSGVTTQDDTSGVTTQDNTSGVTTQDTSGVTTQDTSGVTVTSISNVPSMQLPVTVSE